MEENRQERSLQDENIKSRDEGQQPADEVKPALGKSRKKAEKKKYWIAAVIILVILVIAGAAAVIIYRSRNKEEVSYRETTVQQGELSVGITQSGEISIGSSTQSFTLIPTAVLPGAAIIFPRTSLI